MNLMIPKISILMSTYNRKDFLKYSIESILSQSFTDFEFIIVNNGSTDESDIVCREYEKKDPRIKLVNIKENRGASIGRNTALDKAVGDYLTFIDDDDECEPEMLEFLWELVSKYNADIGICGSWYDTNGIKTPKYIFDELLILDKKDGIAELLKREKYNVAPPAKLFKRSLFENIRFPTGVLVDDIHVIYKVFANAEKTVAQGIPLYSFRKHASNMTNFNQTNKLTPELLKEYLAMYRERTEYLSKRVPEIKERARYSEWSYMISMCDKITKYNCSDCMGIYHFMINCIKQNYEEVVTSEFLTDREKEILSMHIV